MRINGINSILTRTHHICSYQYKVIFITVNLLRLNEKCLCRRITSLRMWLLCTVSTDTTRTKYLIYQIRFCFSFVCQALLCASALYSFFGCLSRLWNAYLDPFSGACDRLTICWRVHNLSWPKMSSSTDRISRILYVMCFRVQFQNRLRRVFVNVVLPCINGWQTLVKVPLALGVPCHTKLDILYGLSSLVWGMERKDSQDHTFHSEQAERFKIWVAATLTQIVFYRSRRKKDFLGWATHSWRLRLATS